MNQATAQTLFKDGGCLLLLGVPEGTEFGIDWNSWTTGPSFQGVKMIPPGIHYIFYSAVSSFDGQSAPRTGFFQEFKPQQIVVKKWLNKSEELLDQPKSDEEIKNIKTNLVDLDKNLGAYPYETFKKWISMSNYCTSHLVAKLSPESTVITSVLEMFPKSKSIHGDLQSNNNQQVDKDGLPLLQVNPATVLRFSKIPEHWYPEGANASEITKHSMDSSYVLNSIISGYNDPVDFLGELQFSFLCFILGQVMDAFDQWKQLLHVICFCESSLSKFKQLYLSLISVLYHQITEIPEDFFVDIMSANNVILVNLSRLFSNIELCDNVELKQRANMFRKYLKKKFKWSFNIEPEDCKPVVVDL